MQTTSFYFQNIDVNICKQTIVTSSTVVTLLTYKFKALFTGQQIFVDTTVSTIELGGVTRLFMSFCGQTSKYMCHICDLGSFETGKRLKNKNLLINSILHRYNNSPSFCELRQSWFPLLTSNMTVAFMWCIYSVSWIDPSIIIDWWLAQGGFILWRAQMLTSYISDHQSLM